MTTTAKAPARKKKPTKKAKEKKWTEAELAEFHRKSQQITDDFLRMDYPETVANTFNEMELDMFISVIDQIKWHLEQLTLDGLHQVSDPKERLRSNVADLTAATALAHLLFQSADVAR
jgi:hypothetical protein